MPAILDPSDPLTWLSLARGLGLPVEHDEVTGGRALRGLLAGKPQEVLSFIPGSDAMGLTDPADRTSGSELLQNFGVAPELAQTGGRAAEVLLNPSAYLRGPGGAVSALGNAAQTIGTAVGVPSSAPAPPSRASSLLQNYARLAQAQGAAPVPVARQQAVNPLLGIL